MKILILNYEFPPIGGGAGKANLCLLKEYTGRDDLKVDVLTSKPEPGFTVEKFSDNVTIYKVGVHKKNLHFWRKIEVLEWLFKAEGHYRKLVEEKNSSRATTLNGISMGYNAYLLGSRVPELSDFPQEN